MVEDARVKVVSVTDKFPYYGIADNGCTSGRSFVTAELISPFDGLPVGVPVVLRIEDPEPRPCPGGQLPGVLRPAPGGQGPRRDLRVLRQGHGVPRSPLSRN